MKIIDIWIPFVIFSWFLVLGQCAAEINPMQIVTSAHLPEQSHSGSQKTFVTGFILHLWIYVEFTDSRKCTFTKYLMEFQPLTSFTCKLLCALNLVNHVALYCVWLNKGLTAQMACLIHIWDEIKRDYFPIRAHSRGKIISFKSDYKLTKSPFPSVDLN